MVQYPAKDVMTTDTNQTVTGVKTFNPGPVIIENPAGPLPYPLQVSRDGTASSDGAFVVHDDGINPWFGIQKSGFYYGISGQIPSPAGTVTIGGYYAGFGFSGITTNTGNPLLTALNQFGNPQFVCYDNGDTWLDGGLATAVNTVTASYLAGQRDSTVLVNGAALTVTLPAAAMPIFGFGSTAGRLYTVKLIAAATTATIATTGGQTIDGAATYTLSAQYKYATVQSDGSNWWIVASN